MSVHQVHPRSTFQKQFRTRPSDSKKQNATFLSVRTAALCRGFVQRFCAEVLCSDTPFFAGFPVSRTGSGVLSAVPCSDTPFQEEKPVSRQLDTGKTEARCSDTPFSAKLPVSRKGTRFRAATHLFKRKNLYRDSRIQEKQKHDAATHPFLQNYLYRER